jgi:hypothetical protein
MARSLGDAAVRVEQGDGRLPRHTAGVRLAEMDDPAAKLTAYFQARTPVRDQELIKFTSAAQAAGRRWASIAAACQVRRPRDTEGIVSGLGGRTRAHWCRAVIPGTQGVVERVTGGRRYPPLTWYG